MYGFIGTIVGGFLLTGRQNREKEKLSRSKVLSYFAHQPTCVVAIEQQDSQALHKARQLAVRQRMSLCNQVRGLAA